MLYLHTSYELLFPLSFIKDLICNYAFQVSSIISVCLAALYPLTLLEIYYSVNALATTDFLAWEDFLERFKVILLT